MRENRTYGSEGGEGDLPDPYRAGEAMTLERRDEFVRRLCDSLTDKPGHHG